MTRLICFEGLSVLLWPWAVPSHVKRGLLEPLALTHDMRPNISIWRGGFMSSGPSARWIPDLSSPKLPKLIVIGHSMGGPTALWYCNQYPDIEFDLVLTLDPRPLHRPYVKPKNVKRAVNFYQTGFMRGYEVEGATNFNVTGYASHTGLPALKEAREILLEAL